MRESDILITQQLKRKMQSNEFSPVAKAFARLVTNIKQCSTTHGAKLEPIQGDVLSARLNDKARLLFITHQRPGLQSACVLLDVLLNHEYHRSKYNQPNARRDFLSKNGAAIEALLTDDKPSKHLFRLTDDITVGASTDAVVAAGSDSDVSAGAGAGAGAGASTEAPVYSKEINFYHRQIVVTSAQQNEHLNAIYHRINHNHQFLGLIAGVPGSGKTLLAFVLTERLMSESHAKASASHILYVTESAPLRDMMHEQWQRSALYTEENQSAVQCCSYSDIITKAGAIIDADKLVNDDHLITFFAKQQSKYNTSTKARGTRSDTTAIAMSTMTPEIFLQECLVMSGCKTLEAYQALGGNHSQFHENKALQNIAWDWYQKYQEHLTHSGAINLKFTPFDVKQLPEGSIVFVDEAQDYSRHQLDTLMACGAKIVFKGDHNQDLLHISHTLEFLRLRIEKLPRHQGYLAKLNTTYRCSVNVAKVATTVLELKKKLTVHGSDLVDDKVISIHDKQGSICRKKPSDIEQIKAWCRSPQTAVICLDERMIDDTKRQLATPLVFSVKQIKGLEYPRIVIWNAITIDLARSLVALSKQKTGERSHISDANKLLTELINHLFTAITRAEVDVSFMQSRNHPVVDELFELLMKNIASVAASAETTEEPTAVDTESAWLREAERLAAHGLSQQADQIALEHSHTGVASIAKPAATAPALTRPTIKKSSGPADLTLTFKTAAKGGRKGKKKKSRSTTITLNRTLTLAHVEFLRDANSRTTSIITPRHMLWLLSTTHRTLYADSASRLDYINMCASLMNTLAKRLGTESSESGMPSYHALFTDDAMIDKMKSDALVFDQAFISDVICQALSNKITKRLEVHHDATNNKSLVATAALIISFTSIHNEAYNHGLLQALRKTNATQRLSITSLLTFEKTASIHLYQLMQYPQFAEFIVEDLNHLYAADVIPTSLSHVLILAPDMLSHLFHTAITYNVEPFHDLLLAQSNLTVGDYDMPLIHEMLHYAPNKWSILFNYAKQHEAYRKILINGLEDTSNPLGRNLLHLFFLKFYNRDTRQLDQLLEICRLFPRIKKAFCDAIVEVDKFGNTPLINLLMVESNEFFVIVEACINTLIELSITDEVFYPAFLKALQTASKDLAETNKPSAVITPISYITACAKQSFRLFLQLATLQPTMRDELITQLYKVKFYSRGEEYTQLETFNIDLMNNDRLTAEAYIEIMHQIKSLAEEIPQSPRSPLSIMANLVINQVDELKKQVIIDLKEVVLSDTSSEEAKAHAAEALPLLEASTRSPTPATDSVSFFVPPRVEASVGVGVGAGTGPSDTISTTPTK
ncbi:MAG: DEAD/DEAH box helicase family protein [Coxiellaceae bacterium]|nr:DEAD/DEAH box helicase family protein [Coxiellaceae bacterium]